MSKAKETARAFGYMTEAEVDALQACVKWIQKNEPTIVNVGAGAGTSGLAIVEANPDANVFTVDVSSGGPFGGIENEVNAFKGTGLPLPVHIRMASHRAAKFWNYGEIDLIFIDDGHLEPEIRGDIEGWLPWMVKGGLMCFHDYGSPKWPDVKYMVDQLLLLKKRKYKEHMHVDSFMAVLVRNLRKKPEKVRIPLIGGKEVETKQY